VAKKPVRPRTGRRAEERANAKLARDQERLAALEPGGDPSRPVAVESASQVEPHALALRCLRCGGGNRLDAHEAVSVEGERLRVARLRCAQCGAPRALWFRLAPRLPN
jgi:hypothetical protein